MEYRELAKIYHMDSSANRDAVNKALANERRQADSAFRLGIVTASGELFVAMPREMSVLYENVLRAERKISTLMRSIPAIASGAMIRGLVLDEVVSTNALEDVHSTRRQVLEALSSSSTNNMKHRRFRELAKLYLGLSSRETVMPQTPEQIRAIYDLVMDGELSSATEPDGELFRKEGVNVTAGGVKVIHRGVEPESAIYDYLEKMLALIRREDVPEAISAIASHYIFEYVHPFYDGNGRLGRYLLSLLLSPSLSTLTVLSLSRIIAEQKSAYYNSFKIAENPLNHGELTFFVYGMLELIKEAQSGIIDRLSESTLTFKSIETVMGGFAESEALDEQEANIVFVLAQYAVFGMIESVDWGSLAAYLGLGKQATRNHAAKLEAKGLIGKETRRPLSFKLTTRAKELLGMAPPVGL